MILWFYDFQSCLILHTCNGPRKKVFDEVTQSIGVEVPSLQDVSEIWGRAQKNAALEENWSKRWWRRCRHPGQDQLKTRLAKPRVEATMRPPALLVEPAVWNHHAGHLWEVPDSRLAKGCTISIGLVQSCLYGFTSAESSMSPND